jgi:hypothetical protein
MWENILSILVILVLSAFFRQTTNNSFNSQMLFILLSLVGLVFYKIMYLNKMRKNKDILILQNKEPFANLDNIVNNFVNNKETNSTDTTQKNENYTDLEEKIKSLETELDDFKKSSTLTDRNSKINSDAMIQDQLNQIRSIDNKIQEQYKTAAAGNNMKNNDTVSIPLYSSCIVATADGSLTPTQPILNNEEEKNNNTDISNLFSNLFSSL